MCTDKIGTVMCAIASPPSFDMQHDKLQKNKRFDLLIQPFGSRVCLSTKPLSAMLLKAAFLKFDMQHDRISKNKKFGIGPTPKSNQGNIPRPLNYNPLSI